MKNQSSNHPSSNRQLPPSQRREIARRKRKRRRQIRRVSLLVVLAIILILFISRGVSCARQASTQQAQNKTVQTTSSDNSNKKKTVKSGSLSLIAVGDNLMHNTLLNDASTDDGYDFTPFYSKIKPYVQAADIAVINQESPLGKGKAEGYPSFNTPQACGDALVDAGFDVISQANNHTMDSTSSAVYDTMDYWDSQADKGVIRIGVSRDADDRATVRYLKRNGIKVGFLAYTYGLNGAKLPESNPDLVSLIDKDKMKEEIAAVKKQCDAVVVVMHWGEEYHATQNEEQEDLAEFLTENGATLIIGAHPHVCEPAGWIKSENGNRAFCVYSLGNFISGQNKAETIVEGMLQVTLTRDESGTVTVKNPGVMPLVCTSIGNRTFRVIPLDDYTEEMASRHTLASRCDVSPDNLRTIAQNAYGKYLIAKTIPKTYDTTSAKKSEKKADS